MANNGIIIDGLIVLILSGITLVSPVMFDVINNFTGLGSEKLSYILIIGFFSGVGITIIGFTLKPRNQTR